MLIWHAWPNQGYLRSKFIRCLLDQGTKAGFLSSESIVGASGRCTASFVLLSPKLDFMFH